MIPYGSPLVYAGEAICLAILGWLIPWAVIVTRRNIKEQEPKK